MSNPFERYNIDPMQGPAAITERMRELIEDADESERDELRAVWEELTTHPRRRLQVALDAFPENRPTDGHGCGPSDHGVMPVFDADAPLTLADVAVVPRVAGALGSEQTPTEARLAAPDLLPPIASDPFINAVETAK